MTQVHLYLPLRHAAQDAIAKDPRGTPIEVGNWKEGERYYTPKLNSSGFTSQTFLNNLYHADLVKRGMIFRSKGEALAVTNKMLKAAGQQPIKDAGGPDQLRRIEKLEAEIRALEQRGTPTALHLVKEKQAELEKLLEQRYSKDAAPRYRVVPAPGFEGKEWAIMRPDGFVITRTYKNRIDAEKELDRLKSMRHRPYKPENELHATIPTSYGSKPRDASKWVVHTRGDMALAVEMQFIGRNGKLTKNRADAKVFPSQAEAQKAASSFHASYQLVPANYGGQDALNHLGEREYQTYGAWRAAAKAAGAVRFEGDKDIASAINSQGKHVGEWLGDKGSIYKTSDAKSYPAGTKVIAPVGKPGVLTGKTRPGMHYQEYEVKLDAGGTIWERGSFLLIGGSNGRQGQELQKDEQIQPGMPQVDSRVYENYQEWFRSAVSKYPEVKMTLAPQGYEFRKGGRAVAEWKISDPSRKNPKVGRGTVDADREGNTHIVVRFDHDRGIKVRSWSEAAEEAKKYMREQRKKDVGRNVTVTVYSLKENGALGEGQTLKSFHLLKDEQFKREIDKVLGTKDTNPAGDVERMFRQKFPKAKSIRVTMVPSQEGIDVNVDGVTWRQRSGSDDDVLSFTSSAGHLTFPIPSSWGDSARDAKFKPGDLVETYGLRGNRALFNGMKGRVVKNGPYGIEVRITEPKGPYTAGFVQYWEESNTRRG